MSDERRDTTSRPSGQAPSHASEEAFALSTEDQALLDESARAGAAEAGEPEPAPEPSPAAPPAPAVPPPSAPDTPREDDEPEETPQSLRERFTREWGTADPETLRGKLFEMFQADRGQRRALAKRTADKRDRDAQIEALSGRLSAVEAENQRLRSVPPPPPAAPPTPPPPAKLAMKRDEDGNLYIDEADLSQLVTRHVPKPEPAKPAAPSAQQTYDERWMQEVSQIAAQSPEMRETSSRLLQAREFLKNGITLAQQKYGHVLNSPLDVLTVCSAYGIDTQLQERWPGLEVQDVMDFYMGGRLAERTAMTLARAWFPTGAPRNKDDLVPELWEDGKPPPRGTETPGRVEAPVAAGNVRRLPLGGKPRTLSATGSNPAPITRQSSMQTFLETHEDKLLGAKASEVSAMADAAIAELEKA